MPRRVPFQANSYYHVYNRGLNKKTIFYSDADYQRFLRNMEKYLEKFAIDLIAYCLLPNHFHFVMLNKQDGLELSNFISKITSSYAKYLGAKYGLQGGKKLFESRFKAKLLADKEYLDQCIHYVEFNAVKHELTDHIEKRMFTSYDKNSKKTTPNEEILALDWEFV